MEPEWKVHFTMWMWELPWGTCPYLSSGLLVVHRLPIPTCQRLTLGSLQGDWSQGEGCCGSYHGETGRPPPRPGQGKLSHQNQVQALVYFSIKNKVQKGTKGSEVHKRAARGRPQGSGCPGEAPTPAGCPPKWPAASEETVQEVKVQQSPLTSYKARLHGGAATVGATPGPIVL